MLHKIEDPLGQVWYVGKGDPCHKLVQKLHTRYYTWIVLPRVMIQGRVDDHYFDFGAGHDWAAVLRKAHQIGYNSQGGKRRLRLAECLKVLGG